MRKGGNEERSRPEEDNDGLVVDGGEGEEEEEGEEEVEDEEVEEEEARADKKVASCQLPVTRSLSCGVTSRRIPFLGKRWRRLCCCCCCYQTQKLTKPMYLMRQVPGYM